MNTGQVIKKYAPFALSFLASGGVIATAVMAAKATPKALEAIKADSRRNHDGDPDAYTPLEAVQSAWRYYIPSTAIGASTIFCIFSANALSRRNHTAISSAYILVQNSYKEYRKKLKELYGEEAHNAIVDAIVREKARDVSISAGGGWYCASLDFGRGDRPENVHLFYDKFSDRYFESTLDKVLQAEYHLNRNFALGGYMAVNDFYDFLGLSGIEGGDELIWVINDEIAWVDFDHRIAYLNDGTEVYLIEFVFDPEIEQE